MKCKNCSHTIWFDKDLSKLGGWHHKRMLHNDNCECRNPEPNRAQMERLQRNLEENICTPTPETLLMIQMAKDLGYNAYWAGDRAKFIDLDKYSVLDVYNMIENLIDLGWTREIDQ